MFEVITVKCDCGSLDHVVILTDYGDGDINIEVQTPTVRGIAQRIRLALRFLFDRAPVHHWSDTYVNETDQKRLAEFFANAISKDT